MINSADPDQKIRSQLIWIWIYIVCKGRVYPGSAGQELTNWMTIQVIYTIFYGMEPFLIDLYLYVWSYNINGFL